MKKIFYNLMNNDIYFEIFIKFYSLFIKNNLNIVFLQNIYQNLHYFKMNYDVIYFNKKCNLNFKFDLIIDNNFIIINYFRKYNKSYRKIYYERL